MTLTDAEAEEAAERLWRCALGKRIVDQPLEARAAALMIVEALAATLPEPANAEQRKAAIAVFMLWMGEQKGGSDAPPPPP